MILSVIIHEIAHGAAAFHLGDPTAKMMGRLSLNPIKHLDPVGSIMVPLFSLVLTGWVIGWAKPVPVNPANFKDQKYGNAKVSLAGPGVNIGIAVLFGLLLRFTGGFGNPGLQLMFSYIVFINLILAIFNLMPIPPLDGSHILFTFLPDSMNSLKVTLQRYGFFILIFFIFFFLQFLFPLITSIFRLIVGSPAPF